MRSLFRAVLCAAALASFSGSGPLLAHEGHDHGEPPPAVTSNTAPRTEAVSEHYELVAIARSGDLVIYLDRFATNESVDGAGIAVETPTGPQPARAMTNEPYRLTAPWSAKPGSYDLIFTVSKDGIDDVLAATLIVPPEDPSKKPTTASLSDIGSGIQELSIRTIPTALMAGLGGFAAGIVLMTLMWRRNRPATVLLLAAMLAMFVGAARAHDGDEHGASSNPSVRDLAQRLPDGGVFVPKSIQRILAIRTVRIESAAHRAALELPGRIIPDPNASGFVQSSVGGRLSPPPNGFPRLGTPVRKGDVLAYMTPPLQAIDASDMRQRQGELDQQITIVERRLARYETLVPSGAIARTQLEDTRTELQGLKERRGSLDKSRREPEELIAPVDGIVAEGTVVAGQMAQSNAIIFHIVDPTRLWVEALSYDSLPGVQSAVARLNNDRSYPLAFRGAGFAGRNQSIPVQFAVQGDVAGLRAGQFVTVLATTDEEKTGFAVPRAAVVRNASGQDVVYEHVAAERFEPRPVRVEPLDGDRVFIATGLAAGKRLVVQGAELLGQVR
jgi:cobalt-zinc-cadmium efflux system membrane fusion protein